MSGPHSIVGEDDEEVAAMVSEGLGLVGMDPAGRIIGFRDRDGIRGAFYMERYTGVGGSIHVHWVGRDKNWLQGYMLTLVAMYCYDQLECEVIFAEVKAKMETARTIEEKVGFKKVARLEGYYPRDDLIIYALRKQECAWLPNEFKEETPDGEERRSA